MEIDFEDHISSTHVAKEKNPNDDRSSSAEIVADEDGEESLVFACEISTKLKKEIMKSNRSKTSPVKRNVSAEAKVFEVSKKRKRSATDVLPNSDSESESFEPDFAGFDESNGLAPVTVKQLMKKKIEEGAESKPVEEIYGKQSIHEITKEEAKSSKSVAAPEDLLLKEDEDDADDRLVINTENIDDETKKNFITAPAKTHHTEEIYRKPFEFGWKRELVYRACPGLSKDKGEVYYISPNGKKLRTRTEIQQYLTAGLTMDNFTFTKEPLGVGPEEELIRSAKPTARNILPEPVDRPGKRIIKPKGPKGASPPPQGWTPAKVIGKAVKSSLVASPRSFTNTKASEEEIKAVITKNPAKNAKVQKKEEPCTIECYLAMGAIPQLQCTKCLCLYHHECVGKEQNSSLHHSSTVELNDGGTKRSLSGGIQGTVQNIPAKTNSYICESCKPKSPMIEATAAAITAPINSKEIIIAAKPTLYNKVCSIADTSSDNITKKPNKDFAPRLVGRRLPSNVNNNNLQDAHLPQSIAVIKGRKYVVIRKPNLTLGTAFGNSNVVATPSRSTSNGDASVIRRRLLQGRLSRQDTVGDIRAESNFIGNVSVGYNILLQTFQYLKVQDLLRAACVCRVWNVAANHRGLWKTVRMKNSQVNNWTGLSAILKRNETKHLDLRKMLISSSNGDEIWTSFCNNITTVESLVQIDLCRCSSKIVESLFGSNPNLKILNAVTIKDDSINLNGLYRLKELQELRLKSIDGFSCESDLSSLKELSYLTHLSLTSFRDLGSKDISVLGELKSLESLELGECSEFKESFADEVLPKLHNLERLRLEKGQDNCCTLEILDVVAKLEKLKQLEMVNFDIKIGFAEKLANCKNIRRLLLIPTYISQSATTNQIVMSAVLQLSESLQILTWAVTMELLRVTALYVDQCDNKKKDKKYFDESIPVLKPVPGIPEDLNPSPQPESDVPQVEILPLDRVENILTTGMPNTKFKILKVPYHATLRQNLVESQ